MSQPAAHPSDKIESLEAVRGLLALWVLVAHVTARIISNATITGAHTQAVLEPLLPVYVFMILSGFVIWGLLQREQQSYGAFLLRRFFRLVPLYLVVLLAAALLVRFQLRTLDNLFWRNPHVYDAIKVHHETLAHFWQHFWAHALLLHGLVSDRWLADANFTFLSQGWSISLEWQFYLLAPVLFFLVARRRYVAFGAGVALLAALHMLGYASVGFLPNQMVYFALGIASFYAWRSPDWYARIPPRAHDAILLALAATLYLALAQPLPILVWLLVLDLVLAKRTGLQTRLTSGLNRVLEMPLLQRLGAMSYSVYLVHIPVLYVVFRAITRLDPHLGGWKFLVLALPATIAASLLVAAATHRWIELPGIALGRTLAQRWTRRAPKAGFRLAH